MRDFSLIRNLQRELYILNSWIVGYSESGFIVLSLRQTARQAGPPTGDPAFIFILTTNRLACEKKRKNRDYPLTVMEILMILWFLEHKYGWPKISKLQHITRELRSRLQKKMKVGFRARDGSFPDILTGTWWIYSLDGSDYYVNDVYDFARMPKNSGFSIRCVKNK